MQHTSGNLKAKYWHKEGLPSSINSMDRVRRIAEQILEKHPDLFTSDFEKNKELLTGVAIIRTKSLRNEIAGYITAVMRDNMEDEPEGQAIEDVVVQPAE